jgi:hypothetical protein
MNKKPNLYDILEHLKANGKTKTNLDLLRMFRDGDVDMMTMLRYLDNTQYPVQIMVNFLESLAE